MPILTLFSGAFCNEKAVTEILLEKTGYRLLSDSHIASEAARLSGMDTGKIERALTGKVSVFNKFTHEKERAVASMKLALAESLEEEGLFVSGFCTHLIPREITHALRVCLIAEMNFRRENAARQRRISEKEALNLIHKRDEVVLKWIWYLYGEEDPWDPAFYDIMIPMDKHSEDEAVSIVLDNLDKDVLNPTARSRQAVEDFKLAARVGVALAREGHDSDVSANNGDITLVINKNVLMLSRLEEDLKAIVSPIEGVKSVRTKVGQDFYKTDIYRKYDFEPLNKVLLVDDEREFVQTLSERLRMRDMGPAVVYDGTEALNFIREEEPEVMILDLKMPGIDGIEVLRKVKQTNPDIEVIVLTGHGSEKDEARCMALGAFAYLQKPVDIDRLVRTMKAAQAKIQQKKKTK